MTQLISVARCKTWSYGVDTVQFLNDEPKHPTILSVERNHAEFVAVMVYIAADLCGKMQNVVIWQDITVGDLWKTKVVASMTAL
jgi:hypothetical protein